MMMKKQQNVWAYLKSYLRRNCTYNFKDLKALIPVALDEVIPIAVFRRFARHCYRYMDGYEKGIEGPLLDFASKKYSSHRALPIGLTAAQVQIDLAEDKLAKRMRFKTPFLKFFRLKVDILSILPIYRNFKFWIGKPIDIDVN